MTYNVFPEHIILNAYLEVTFWYDISDQLQQKWKYPDQPTNDAYPFVVKVVDGIEKAEKTESEQIEKEGKESEKS